MTNDLSTQPDWLISELITDCFCNADFVGENTERGKEYTARAEELIAELTRREEAAK